MMMCNVKGATHSDEKPTDQHKSADKKNILSIY